MQYMPYTYALHTPIRVLYVDDYPFDRELVRDALERDPAGYEVLEASSREAFEARMAEAEFDIVLTDFNILGFEGLQVLDTVQATLPHIPVVLLTGTGSEEVAVEAMKRGIADYIVKTPARIRLLPQTIRKILDQRLQREMQASMARELRESEARFQALVEGSLQGISIINQDGIRVFANRAFASIFGYDDPHEVLGVESMRIVAPHERERLSRYMAARLQGEKPLAHYEFQGVCKDGSLIWLENLVRPVVWRGEPAVQNTLVDITARKRAEAALRERLRQFEAIRTVALEITRELDLTTLLHLIVRRAVELIGVPEAGGSIWLWDETIQGLSPAAWTPNRAWVRGQHLKLGNGVTGRVAQQRQGCIVENYTESPHAHPCFRDRSGAKSILSQPLLYRDRCIGVINVSHSTKEKPFTRRDLDLLALFAAQAAIAIENARLYAEVLQTRDFLQAIAEHSVDGIVTTDTHGHITYFSPGAEVISGFRATEVVPYGTMWQFYQGGRAEAARVMANLQGKGALRNYETTLRTKSGGWTDVSSSMSLLRDSKAHITGTLSIIKDITANKRMEQALRHSEACYRTLVEGSIQGISISRDSLLMFVNTAFARIFGYDRPETLFGRDWRELVMPQEYERLLAYGQARARGEAVPSRYIFQGRRRDGSPIWIETVKSLLWWEGEPAILGTSVDITETRRLEQEILHISEHEQRRLGQDLHDDLGQRLTGIAFLSKALTQRLASRSASEAHDAATLNDLLNAALSQTRKLARCLYPVELETQGLRAALQSFAASVEALWDVSCKVLDHEEWNAFDQRIAIHLYRIVQEAVTNAIKHGRARRVEVRLEGKPDNALITVQDDGHGFPAPENKTTEFGLQIMRHRASMIRGTLEIRPTADRGTLVMCQVPRLVP